MKRLCLNYNCEKEGKANLKLEGTRFNTKPFVAFACKEHVKKEIQISKGLGFSVEEIYKHEPEHICSLILCSECMKDVRKHLSF